MELINTIGTRVRVRDDHADRLIAAGYTHPEPNPEPNGDDNPPAKPARRTTTRAARRTTSTGKRS